MKKVIIVEDNMLISTLYRHYLNKLNYHIVAEVTNGKEAIQVIKEKEADVIIMDIMLDDDMTGINVVEEIRKTIKTPVIFATGNSDDLNRKKAESFENTDFLVKPVAIDDLTKAIKKAELVSGVDD